MEALFRTAELAGFDKPGEHAEERGDAEEKSPEPAVAERGLALRGVGERGEPGKGRKGEAQADQRKRCAHPHGDRGGNSHLAMLAGRIWTPAGPEKKTPRGV